ncbi:GNAT family N-acetyltransferase [Enterococcus eurekensis]|uniref:GNAT family N-acetyltransferase n=2 Tax=Enterococcus TaxID=1350 RepID=A0ABV9M325_9ENTE
MFQELDLSNNRIAEAVYRIQKAAYQIEAELLGTDQIPPLQESFTGLQEVDESFIGFYQKKKLTGVLSYKIEEQVIDVYRLFIDPSALRQGIGKKLLNYVCQQHKNCQKMIVSTGEKNQPAVHFYEAYGFEKESEVVISENLTVFNFKKDLW